VVQINWNLVTRS